MSDIKHNRDWAMTRLAELENLEDGWYDGDGKAVPIPAIHAMRALFERLEEQALPCPLQSPMAEGGISAAWQCGSRRVMLDVASAEDFYDFFEMWLCSFSVDENANPTGAQYTIQVEVSLPQMDFGKVCEQVAWCEEKT